MEDTNMGPVTVIYRGVPWALAALGTLVAYGVGRTHGQDDVEESPRRRSLPKKKKSPRKR